MRPKKPSAAFEVLFEGQDIVPEAIPLTVLSRSFSAVQRLASGDELVPDVEESEHYVSLLSVKRGSARFECAAKSPQMAVTNLRLVGAMMSAPEVSDDIAFAFNPLEDLSAVARSLGCTITLRAADDRRTVLAKIEPDTFGRVARSLLLEGDTTITGRVERAGGAIEMRCALRVSFQHTLLYCRVESEEAVRKLGERLYQNVAVSGQAKWIRGSWRVVHFTIRDVQQPHAGSVDEAFAALRAAGGDAWDRIPDPQKFLRDTTGD